MSEFNPHDEIRDMLSRFKEEYGGVLITSTVNFSEYYAPDEGAGERPIGLDRHIPVAWLDVMMSEQLDRDEPIRENEQYVKAMFTRQVVQAFVTEFGTTIGRRVDVDEFTSLMYDECNTREQIKNMEEELDELFWMKARVPVGLYADDMLDDEGELPTIRKE